VIKTIHIHAVIDLVLTPISGFQPHTSSLRPDHLPAFQNLPYIEYYVSYALPEELKGEYEDPVHVVQARLRETPNLQWARYLSKLPDSGNYRTAQTTVTQVVKFGQKIVKDDSQIPDYGYGIGCFHWPSQNFAVSVCFEHMTANDEFLRVYLQKYPSDW
jgi:hypothetical protein